MRDNIIYDADISIFFQIQIDSLTVRENIPPCLLTQNSIADYNGKDSLHEIVDGREIGFCIQMTL
jgi:hypothetical protein